MAALVSWAARFHFQTERQRVVHLSLRWALNLPSASWLHGGMRGRPRDTRGAGEQDGGPDEDCKLSGAVGDRGGGQWNPVDEVTYMPGVIKRLWLLYLREL